MGKGTVITMIGSMKFFDIMLKEGARLEAQGFVVLFPIKLEDQGVIANNIVKENLDDNIRSKIDMAEVVYVINHGGYIGKSTESEIEYAKLNHKKIIYYYFDLSKYDNGAIPDLTDISNNESLFDNIIKYPTVALIGSYKFIDLFAGIYRKLTTWGFIVVNPRTFAFDHNQLESFSKYAHNMFDRMEREIIKTCDYVLIVDGNTASAGYIGEDTRIEMNYAAELHKRIFRSSKDGVDELIRFERSKRIDG